MSKGRVRYVWVPVALALVATALGLAYVHWSKSGPGAGLYSQAWSPDPVQGWWDPGRFFTPVQGVQGVFEASQCIQCHEAITPGIVADWRGSRHARLTDGAGCDPDPAGCRLDAPPSPLLGRGGPGGVREVACPDCHGADHQRLRLPTPEVLRGLPRQAARGVSGRGPLRLPQPCPGHGAGGRRQALRRQA
jgi:hydroxylamine dehydrogenase